MKTAPNATLNASAATGSTSNLTTYTFSSQSIGTANANRVVAVIVQTQGTVSTVTIGGIGATLLGGTQNVIAYAVVPLGQRLMLS